MTLFSGEFISAAFRECRFDATELGNGVQIEPNQKVSTTNGRRGPQCAGKPAVSLTRFACQRCRRSCALTIRSPVPTVNRNAEMNGFLKRKRFKSTVLLDSRIVASAL